MSSDEFIILSSMIFVTYHFFNYRYQYRYGTVVYDTSLEFWNSTVRRTCKNDSTSVQIVETI